MQAARRPDSSDVDDSSCLAQWRLASPEPRGDVRDGVPVIQVWRKRGDSRRRARPEIRDPRDSHSSCSIGGDHDGALSVNDFRSGLKQANRLENRSVEGRGSRDRTRDRDNRLSWPRLHGEIAEDPSRGVLELNVVGATPGVGRSRHASKRSPRPRRPASTHSVNERRNFEGRAGAWRWHHRERSP
jgi:hypothetical protein